MSRVDEALRRHNPSGPEGFAPYGYGRQLGPPPGHVRDMDPSEALEPRRLLRSLFRRRWQILLVAALVLIPVTVATLLTEPEYVSAALVEIEPEPAQVLPYREIDLPSLTPNYEMFMKSQEQLLRSPTLISRVAERLSSDPGAETLRPEIPRLGSQFAVQRLENTQIFRLGYGAPDPEVAANLANVFAEEYIKRHYESRQETRKKANQFLQRELEELENRVQVSETNLVTYAQTHRLPAMEQPGQGLAPQKLSELNQELTRAEGEVFLARARHATLQKASVENFPDKLTTNVISGLIARLTQLENDLANLRGTFGENWPAVIQKRGEIRLVGEQIAREKSAALQQASEQASLDLAAAENRMGLVASSFTSQQATVNTLESASIQYNILRREVETNRKMYEGLLERLKQTSVTSGIDLGGFRIVEAARPSETPDSPRLWWNLLLASLLGLALGVCVALGRDYWDTSVSTVEEVEQLTVLPVLGSVPRVRPAGTVGLLTWARVGGSGGIVRGASSTALNLRKESPAAVRLPDDPALAESIRNVCASICCPVRGTRHGSSWSRPPYPPRGRRPSPLNSGRRWPTAARRRYWSSATCAGRAWASGSTWARRAG